VKRARALCTLALLVACQGLGIVRDELGERPFALLWFDPETQRRRAELIQDSDPRSQKVGPRGTVYVEAFADYLTRAFDIADPNADAGSSLHARLTKRFPGRLALVSPRSGETKLLPATPGAKPQDWSTDGNRLLYTQLVGRFLQLFIYDLRSETVQPVSLGSEVHVGGCFGPEDRLVVVASGVTDGLAYSRLDITEPGGIRPAPYTEGPSDFDVACAPDGSPCSMGRFGTSEKGDSPRSRQIPSGSSIVAAVGTVAGRCSAFARTAVDAARSARERATRSSRPFLQTAASFSTCQTTVTTNASTCVVSMERATAS
jgi:hypothetical protein